MRVSMLETESIAYPGDDVADIAGGLGEKYAEDGDKHSEHPEQNPEEEGNAAERKKKEEFHGKRKNGR